MTVSHALLLAIGILAALAVIPNLVFIHTPNIALRKHMGVIQFERLEPGPHIVWYFKGYIPIQTYIVIPGGLIDIQVPIEEVVAHNVSLSFNCRIQVHVHRAPDRLPAFGAAVALVTWLSLRSDQNLRDEVEDLIASFISDAAEQVLKQYKPQNLTKSRRAIQVIAAQVDQAVTNMIYEWGVVDKVSIEDLKDTQEVRREAVRRDLAVEQQKITALAEAEVNAIEMYRQVGEPYAQMYIAGKTMKEAKNINLWWIPGISGILDAFLRRRDE